MLSLYCSYKCLYICDIIIYLYLYRYNIDMGRDEETGKKGIKNNHTQEIERRTKNGNKTNEHKG